MEPRLREVKELAQSQSLPLFPKHHAISKDLPNPLCFSHIFLRLHTKSIIFSKSFIFCKKTRVLTILRTPETTYTPTACVCVFYRQKCKCVLFSECWVRERKKAALPGMWTILSDALMSLAESRAFKGRCTLPSLVSHILPKAEEFQAKEKVPLSGTVTGP